MISHREYKRVEKHKSGVSIRVLMMCLLLCIFGLADINALTLHVPGDFPTITEAVDYAIWNDTVLVAPGVYDTASGELFPISFYLSGIVLMSDSGPLVTTIDANQTDRVFKCDSLDSTTVITGFTITGGNASKGGGIYCNNCYMEIRNNIIKGNSARSGGGIYCNRGVPGIIANRITENVSPDWCGGGIYCLYSSAVIDSNVVTRNTATFGGGVFNDNSSTTIMHNIVEGNRSRESGGGLDCYMNSSPTITGNVVIGNIAGTNGAGIACCYNCSPTISHNTIACNVGTYGGGIRSLGNSSPTILANIIVDNVDGVYLTASSGPVTATGNHLYLNTYQIGNYEVINNTSNIIELTDNFWWVTDSSSIDLLIYGPSQFIPFLTSMSNSVPGEPSSVASVTAMADSNYGKPISGSVDIGDTLYIQLEGIDWNSSFIEPALVIITSHKDSHGIGVALIETGTATGVYRGVVHLHTYSSDSRNQIGVNPTDTIVIRTNVEPMICDTVTVQPTGVEREDGSRWDQRPDDLQLYQNNPNPFSAGTNIWFSLPKRMQVTIKIYDSAGRLVKTLVDTEKFAGSQKAYWDGTGQDAQKVHTGIYFCKLSAGNFNTAKKMILLR